MFLIISKALVYLPCLMNILARLSLSIEASAGSGSFTGSGSAGGSWGGSTAGLAFASMSSKVFAACAMGSSGRPTAVAGCSAHMVGFAVASFRENKLSGLISQGLGTSMLQIPNIMRKPKIMLPEIIASAIVGPVAVAFGLLCDETGGGMGTSGLVGVISTISTSINNGVAAWRIGLGVALCLFVIPAVVCFVISEFMRKKSWIEFGDMKLDD